MCPDRSHAIAAARFPSGRSALPDVRVVRPFSVETWLDTVAADVHR
jgi:hypothetical protein